MGPDDPFPGDTVGQPVRVERHLAARSAPSRLRPRARRHRRVLGGDPAGRGAADDPALPVVRGWVRRRPTPRRRRPRARPSWSAGCSRPRAPARPTPTRPTTCSRSCAPPTWSSTSTRTSTAPTPSSTRRRRRQPGTAGLEPADLEQLPEAGRFTARAQPALRPRVVVLRRRSRCSSGGAACATRPPPGQPEAGRRRRPGTFGAVTKPLRHLPRAGLRRRRAAGVLLLVGAAAEVPRHRGQRPAAVRRGRQHHVGRPRLDLHGLRRGRVPAGPPGRLDARASRC